MNIILISEIIATLMGLAAWKSARPEYLRIVIALIVLTCLMENTEEFLPHLVKRRFRFLIYNIFSLIEISAWMMFYFNVFKASQRLKLFVIILGITSILFSLTELSIYSTWFRFHVDSYRFYSLSMIFLSVAFLWKLMNLDEIYSIWTDPVFWFAAAAIIFHSVFFIHLTVINIKAFANDPGSISVFNTLLDIANVFYYLLLCIGLYLSLRNYWRFKHPSSKM
ncbi:MAG: hypothetical protein JWN76_466 [Chitinophagaceae bacterium]|nr:hypothetical protein [Chitinophagaceae bacterium]